METRYSEDMNVRSGYKCWTEAAEARTLDGGITPGPVLAEPLQALTIPARTVASSCGHVKTLVQEKGQDWHARSPRSTSICGMTSIPLSLIPSSSLGLVFSLPPDVNIGIDLTNSIPLASKELTLTVLTAQHSSDLRNQRHQASRPS